MAAAAVAVAAAAVMPVWSQTACDGPQQSAVAANVVAETVVGVVLAVPLTSRRMLLRTYVEIVHTGVAPLAPQRWQILMALVVIAMAMNYNVKLVAA